jgi:hypothetical protein
MKLLQIVKNPEHARTSVTGGNVIALTCRHCIHELGETQAIGFNAEIEGHSMKTVVLRLRELEGEGLRYEPAANCRHTRGITL